MRLSSLTLVFMAALTTAGLQPQSHHANSTKMGIPSIRYQPHYSQPSIPITPPRLHPRAPNIHLRYIKIHKMYLPIPLASTALALFFQNIQQETLNYWCRMPPQTAIRISQGFLNLSAHGYGMSIPWELLAEVAANMIVMTARGFSGTWDISYDDAQGGIVNLEMRIGAMAAFERLTVDVPDIGSKSRRKWVIPPG